MRSELFEEAWKQNRHVWESTKCLAQAMYLAGEQHQQPKVDALTLQVAEMKSRLNDAYTDGQSAMYTARQSKVDELERRNQMLNDNIKEQGQKLVHQNEVIETQAEKLLGLRDENAELQKRVDAAFRVLSQLNTLDDEAHKRWKREACMFSQGESNAYEHAVRLLEQALKGESNESST